VNQRNLCVIKENDNSVLKITRPCPVSHSFHRVLSFFLSSIQSFILYFVSLTTGTYPLSKSSSLHGTIYWFLLQFPISFSLRSSSSCLRILTPLPITSVLPSVVPSITCFRRQFLHKMWPIQLAFLLVNVGYFCPSWLFVILFHFSDVYRVRMFFLKLLIIYICYVFTLGCLFYRVLEHDSCHGMSQKMQALYATNLPYPGRW
jgi:hypothetical protein